MQFLTYKPSPKNLLLLFVCAFIIRAAFFFVYIQHQERYNQADSPDYHMSALALALGRGMTRLHDGQPNFWRTPGYPCYISVFNTYFGITGIQFSQNESAHKAALWLQLFLCSIIPIILFFLALSLTGYLPIAWITAWISVFHVGLILASLFLLTEGLTLIFFYLFLLFFYRSFTTYGSTASAQHWAKNISIAALLLGISTWLRPMGLFVSAACALLLLLIARDSIKLKLKKIFLFFLVFFACLSPWYIRNYQLTGKIFFCPMFGTYLNCFIAPKIIRETHKMPLLESWALMQNKVQQEAMPQALQAQAAGKIFVTDYCSAAVALPLVLQHPWITTYFWTKESLKTAFDIYSYQLVAIAKGSWKWDPLEEHLSQKVAEGLYTQPLPLWMRIIFWLDFIYTLVLWLCVFAGFFIYLLYPLIKRFQVTQEQKHMAAFWFKLLFLTAAIIGMTGGFGYARLRLPVEPLLIILALTFLFCYGAHKKIKIS